VDIFEYFRNLKVFACEEQEVVLTGSRLWRLYYSYGLSLFREELGVLREALHTSQPPSRVYTSGSGRLVDWWEAQPEGVE